MKTKLQLRVYIICSLLLGAVIHPFNSFGQCGSPFTINATPITTNSATVLFSCSSCNSATQILEYGLAGFTPGNGANSGVGGTVVSFATFTTSYTINGLQGNTTYDYYTRLNCGSGVFTPNSVVRTFTTAFNCAAAPVVSCNTNQIVTSTAAQGAWNLCSFGFGNERLYSFTPTVTGIHFVVVPNTNTQVYVSYKTASLGCNEQNWNCIGTALPGTINQFATGSLVAGTTYYIALDANSAATVLNASFRVECPYCGPPVNLSSISTAYSVTLNWTGSAGIVEYGPQGFAPGTGNVAGSASSAIVSGTSGITISNLNPATVYDFYVRANCGGGNYSPNSIKYSAVTKNCPFILSYGALGTDLGMTFDMAPALPNQNNCSVNAPGGENIVTFTPPSTGYYNLKVVNGNYANGLGYTVSRRISAAGCNMSGFTNCLSPSFASNTDIYPVGPLTAGTTYEFLFDGKDTSACQFPICTNSAVISFNCPSPSGVVISNIQPNAVTANWNCNCPNTTYLEYGPSGFTPGTGTSPGTNGTVISGVSSPYILSGLTTDTKYDLYFRSSCGGSFTANTPVINIRTAQSCTNATSLSCGSYFNYAVFTSGPFVGGSWAPSICGGTTDAKENMWKFTPSVSGSYSLFIYSFYTNSVNYQYPINIFTKNASLPCNEQNWVCAATASFSGVSFVPTVVSIGTLTAGTTYLIMVDGVQPTFTSGYSYAFRLECPNVCGSPISLGATSVTSNSAQIAGVCNNCTGTKILEYGPAGFTPGTGTTPGIGGTLISNFSYPVTLSGLTAGTNYEVYVRQNCGGAQGFSVNQGPATFTTTGCNTPPVSISSSTGSNSICSGTTITLTQVGGVPGAGGTIKWYTGSCGGTLAGSGNSITVTPSSNTTYYARAEASCGNSNCVSVSITVNALPTAAITASGPVTFCAGNSVVLNANTGTGLTYQWKKYANNLAGATTASYTASGTGKYKCVVTNSPGCTKNSNVIDVTSNPLPTATITAGGPTTFCAGGSVVLSANSGAGLTYQWKKYANNIAGAVNASYTAAAAGKYKCVVTNANGCSKASNSITVNVPCRIGELEESSFEIYPNPSMGIFKVVKGYLEDVVIEIKDLTGKLVYSSVLIDQETEIDLHKLKPGVYIAFIKSNGTSRIKKLIIN